MTNDVYAEVTAAPEWAKYRSYLDQQRPRIEHLARTVCELRTGTNVTRVLDVGPGVQTELLRALRPEWTVDSIGYALDAVEDRPNDHHYEFDLNDLYARRPTPEPGGYDVLVFAEVLEHLCTAPQTIFDLFASWVVPGGHIVVQTPNALDLPARLRALLGRRPAGSIATLPRAGINIGHFREYTIDEVLALGSAAGLEVHSTGTHEYFARTSLPGRAWTVVGSRLPPGLRTGTMAVFRRPR